MKRVVCPLVVLACTAASASPQLEWRVDTAPSQPGSAAYDAVRQRIVMLEHQTSWQTSRTWEWSGDRWVRREPIQHAVMSAGALHWDPARGQCVLTRGNDVWAFDGITWTRPTAQTITPNGFDDPGVCWDGNTGGLLRFGGSPSLFEYQDETWGWDGAAWSQLFPAAKPAPRAESAMAWDSVRNVVVLFGGWSFGALFDDTWEWNGSTWTLRHAGGAGTPSTTGMTAFDAERGRVVMIPVDSGGLRYETWEWDGGAWTEIAAANPPARSTSDVLVYDEVRERVVLFGRGVEWTWDGATWTRGRTSNRAANTTFTAYDTAREQVVAVGADATGTLAFETWEWDGDWQQHFPAQSPDPDVWGVLAFDEARQETVMFGGRTSVGPVFPGETWTWDGAAWTQHTLEEGPQGRWKHAMFYDAQRETVILFGGGDGNQQFGDTWEWNGSTWTELFPEGSPSPREAHAMAYDPVRQRGVLFGGFADPSSSFLQTWEWDGTTWSDVSTNFPQFAGTNDPMTYDATLGQVVLVSSGRTWAWDGAAWTQLAGGTYSLINGAWEISMSHHAARQQTVLRGRNLVYEGSVTMLQGATLASVVRRGTACAGSAGSDIAAFGLPTLGNTDFALEVVSTIGNTPAAMLFGVGPAALPFGGCTLLLDPTLPILSAAMALNAGFDSLELAIPELPQLLGAPLIAQAAVLDTSVGRFAFTSAIDMTFGR